MHKILILHYQYAEITPLWFADLTHLFSMTACKFTNCATKIEIHFLALHVRSYIQAIHMCFLWLDSCRWFTFWKVDLLPRKTMTDSLAPME